MLVLYFLICIAGLLCGVILFGAIRVLKKEETYEPEGTISVIIPVKKGMENLAQILKDLKRQGDQIFEIICVLDKPDGELEQTITSYGGSYIMAGNRPFGWTEKAHAYYLGTEKAEGDYFLFLDEDVRLSPEAVTAVWSQACKRNGVVTVQPYHTPVYFYEQLSMFLHFTIASVAGKRNFAALSCGLYGPVIFISRKDYIKIGGQLLVKEQVLEDIEVGAELNRCKIPFTRMVGGNYIGFRMYPGGIRRLAEGWIESFTAMALKITVWHLLFILIWLMALCQIPVQTAAAIIQRDMFRTAVFCTLYAAAAIELKWISTKTGDFSLGAIIGYPVCIAGFIVFSLLSVLKRLFRLPVMWKEKRI